MSKIYDIKHMILELFKGYEYERNDNINSLTVYAKRLTIRFHIIQYDFNKSYEVEVIVKTNQVNNRALLELSDIIAMRKGVESLRVDLKEFFNYVDNVLRAYKTYRYVYMYHIEEK